MIQKIKRWWKLRRRNNLYEDNLIRTESYTREQLEKVYALGYNDGQRDGLAIAREQATKSLKEILWRQNNQNRTK